MTYAYIIYTKSCTTGVEFEESTDDAAIEAFKDIVLDMKDSVGIESGYLVRQDTKEIIYEV